jgi:hypothetical protein
LVLTHTALNQFENHQARGHVIAPLGYDARVDKKLFLRKKNSAKLPRGVIPTAIPRELQSIMRALGFGEHSGAHEFGNPVILTRMISPPNHPNCNPEHE